MYMEKASAMKQTMKRVFIVCVLMYNELNRFLWSDNATWGIIIISLGSSPSLYQVAAASLSAPAKCAEKASWNAPRAL